MRGERKGKRVGRGGKGEEGEGREGKRRVQSGVSWVRGRGDEGNRGRMKVTKDTWKGKVVERGGMEGYWLEEEVEEEKEEGRGEEDNT